MQLLEQGCTAEFTLRLTVSTPNLLPEDEPNLPLGRSGGDNYAGHVGAEKPQHDGRGVPGLACTVAALDGDLTVIPDGFLDLDLLGPGLGAEDLLTPVGGVCGKPFEEI